MAEKLHQKEKAGEIQEDLEKTMKLLKALGNVEVTINQVRELLWQQSQDHFESKAEFDQFWNNTKLGRMLKKYTCRRTRVSIKDSRRKYFLTAEHSFG